MDHTTLNPLGGVPSTDHSNFAVLSPLVASSDIDSIWLLISTFSLVFSSASTFDAVTVI